MAGTTIFDPAAASQAVSEFNSKMTEMVEACNKMNTSVQNLTGDVWSGTSATTYFGKFFELMANLSKTQDKVSGGIEKLNWAIQQYEESQTTAAQMANAVEEGTTPPVF